MLRVLKLLFAGILTGMLYVTIVASLDRSVFEAGNLLEDPWGVATLADAYFAFLTFYVWVFYKERRLLARGAWLLLILALGNIAMSSYVLIQLFRLPAGAPLESLLIRAPRSARGAQP
jgi:hypothetical protein